MSKHLNPVNTISSLWARRELISQLVGRNVESRYKGTMMGLAWMVMTPLVMLAVYTFVFSVVFKARWGTDFGDSRAAFALIMFCGMVVFNVFSESVNGSVTVVTGNPNYVKKVVFPLEVLPVVSVLTAGFFGLVWLGILFAGVGVFFHKICLAVICLPLVFLPLFFLSCGMAWFMGSLGVYVRDLPHAVALVLQILFFMTPVFYNVDMVPECLRFIFHINPLTTIINSTRLIMIYDQWPKWPNLALVTLGSLIVFQLGYFWFMKTKRGFADVL